MILAVCSIRRELGGYAVSRTKKIVRVIGADERGLRALRTAACAGRFEFQPLCSRDELTRETTVPLALLLDEWLSELQTRPPAALVASRDSLAMKIARYLGLQIGLRESMVPGRSPASRGRHRGTEPSLASEAVRQVAELDSCAVDFRICVPPEFPLWLTWTPGIHATHEGVIGALPSLDARRGTSRASLPPIAVPGIFSV